MDFYERLARRSPRLMEPGETAAVLLAFLKKEGEWHLLLEQRAEHLNRQPGEICLPGGMAEPGETARAAALREACEELLLTPAQLKLWGAGDVLPTPSGSALHCFYGEILNYTGSFASCEVQSVFTIPVKWLLENPPREYTSRLATVPGEDFPFDLIPGGKAYPWRQGKWPVFFYSYEGRVIWGITAKIIYRGLAALKELGGLPPI